MKYWAKQIAVFFCAAVVLTQSVYGAVLLDYDAENRTLTVNGTVSPVRTKNHVSFAILPAEQRGEMDNLKSVLYHSIETERDGAFSCEITLPDNFQSGRYEIRTTGDTPLEVNVFGVSSEEASQADLAAVNAASGAVAMKEALLEMTTFQFDRSILATYGDKIGAYLYSQRNGAYTWHSFAEAYCMGEGLARLQAGDISLDDFLIQYSAYTGVNYVIQWEPLSDKVKAEAQQLMESSPVGEEPFTEYFEDLCQIASFRGAESAADLGKLYLQYAADNGISLTAYNSLSAYRQDNVFTKLMGQMETVTSMQQLERLFAQNVEEAAKTASDDSSGPSASGGRGGGSGGGVYMGQNAQNNVVDAPDDAGNPSDTNTDVVFSDVLGHWGQRYIELLQQTGAIQGYGDGSFHPDAEMTRAEFVKTLCGLIQTSSTAEITFTDVTPEDWFYEPICTAYGAGWIQGVTENAFAPDEFITREDAAVVLQRAWKFTAAQQREFADTDQISDYAAEAISALVEQGILTGYEDNTLRPKGFITRAEVCALLIRAQEASQA